ncbi:hypothetical protein JHK82_012313 [Glycine max]|nr:hypothetical protein JHK85_012668 [Glycine max]KAG5057330.1 hypothetical protein JHK86_012326 [Glycine max]KAG5154344.1 hypothetical protein JHK82_012313 [Glycine max]
MARVADKIKLIDGSRETLKLSVRIIDLWFIGIPGKTEQAEMVVVDSDGDEIHVVCKQDQLKSRKADLKENLTYFLSYLNDIEDERPIVILLTHARIKEAQGSYPASVSNSFKASKLMINDLVLEIQEFRERYRVEVMVNHKGEQTKFLIWDRECAQLIGQSTDEVNRLIIEDGDADLNASPQALDRLLGCFLAFKVKVQPRFRNSVVLKYSNELDLINVVLDMIPDSEQSVSVTGDHDPLLRIPLTPTKRVSSDELDNEQKNFQISPAEVSSNKLAKHSQPE